MDPRRLSKQRSHLPKQARASAQHYKHDFLHNQCHPPKCTPANTAPGSQQKAAARTLTHTRTLPPRTAPAKTEKPWRHIGTSNQKEEGLSITHTSPRTGDAGANCITRLLKPCKIDLSGNLQNSIWGSKSAQNTYESAAQGSIKLTFPRFRAGKVYT